MPKIGDRLNDYVIRVSQLRAVKKKDQEGFFHIFKGTNAEGTIGCVVWNPDVDFKNGDYLKVTGEVKPHKEGLQLVVQRWQVLPREDFPPDQFVPRAARPVEEMVHELANVIDLVDAEPVRAMLRSLLLEDPSVAPKYHRAPAAKTHHHPYLGGLLEHSLTSVRRALGMCLEQEADRDVVIAGILLHDLGKIEEYSFEGDSIEFTEAGNLIGHVTIGYTLVRQAILAQPDFRQDQAMNILHCVLSHQGRLEYGSPVEPKTVEALIVHAADALDTHLFQVRQAGLDAPEQRLGYSRSLNRVVLGNPQIASQEPYRI